MKSDGPRPPADPLALSDAELSRLLRELRDEAGRRAAAAAGRDVEIRGHEFAKRAALVAAAGGHSLLLWGGAGCGKTLLRAFALRLGVRESYELRPCPCGSLGDALVACRCDPAQVAEYRARNRVAADISVEVCRVPEREFRARGAPPAHYAGQLGRAAAAPAPAGLGPDAEDLLGAAVNELGLTHRERQAVVAVAATVARLDGAGRVSAAHVCEAVSYRRPGWLSP